MAPLHIVAKIAKLLSSQLQPTPAHRNQRASPAFLRDVIRSVLNGIPIGEIVVRQAHDSLHELQNVALLDGLQRLEALRLFHNNELPVKIQTNLYEYRPICFREMDKDVQKSFLDFEVAVCVVNHGKICPDWNRGLPIRAGEEIRILDTELTRKLDAVSRGVGKNARCQALLSAATALVLEEEPSSQLSHADVIDAIKNMATSSKRLSVVDHVRMCPSNVDKLHVIGMFAALMRLHSEEDRVRLVKTYTAWYASSRGCIMEELKVPKRGTPACVWRLQRDALCAVGRGAVEIIEIARGTKRKQFTKKDRLNIAARQDHMCGQCGCSVGYRPTDSSFEVDHKVPLFAGGSNSDTNLQALCTDCHTKKTNRDREETQVARPLKRRAQMLE